MARVVWLVLVRAVDYHRELLMQTPAGAELSADGTKALMTDFFAAALNYSTLVRYSHVVVGLLIMGSFIALAVGAWYLKKNRHIDFAMKTVRVATVCAIVTTGCHARDRALFGCHGGRGAADEARYDGRRLRDGVHAALCFRVG